MGLRGGNAWPNTGPNTWNPVGWLEGWGRAGLCPFQPVPARTAPRGSTPLRLPSPSPQILTLTLARPDGSKKAYVRLTTDYDALDVANKIGII